MGNGSIGKTIDYWKSELRLSDWVVTYSVEKRPRDTNGSEVLGQIHSWLEEKRAHITLQCSKKVTKKYRNSTFYKMHINAFDMERTIVHELLHLHFEDYDMTQNIIPLEQALNILADKLVSDRIKIMGGDL